MIYLLKRILYLSMHISTTLPLINHFFYTFIQIPCMLRQYYMGKKLNLKKEEKSKKTG
jgi:hypothetical protein